MAAASFQEALRLDPNRPDTYRRIANVRLAQGRLDDAMGAFRMALGLDSDNRHVHSALIFTMNYHPGCDARMIRDECARWNHHHAEPLKQFIVPHDNEPDPDRRLRIGAPKGSKGRSRAAVQAAE